jgi:hypothetical protein
MDTEKVLRQLEADMRKSSRGGYRPNEVVGLVEAAIAKVQEGDQEPRCAHEPAGVPCNRGRRGMGFGRYNGT